jgi:hypothetical protein
MTCVRQADIVRPRDSVGQIVHECVEVVVVRLSDYRMWGGLCADAVACPLIVATLLPLPRTSESRTDFYAASSHANCPTNADVEQLRLLGLRLQRLGLLSRHRMGSRDGDHREDSCASARRGRRAQTTADTTGWSTSGPAQRVRP